MTELPTGSAQSQLPSRPSLDYLKNQSKRLRNAHRAGTARAVQRIGEHHPRLADKSEDEILSAKFSVQDAQAVVAREYGLPCVVGTEVGSQIIPDGATITVDGAQGIVRIEG